jgi:hypothetical protein
MYGGFVTNAGRAQLSGPAHHLIGEKSHAALGCVIHALGATAIAFGGSALAQDINFTRAMASRLNRSASSCVTRLTDKNSAALQAVHTILAD